MNYFDRNDCISGGDLPEAEPDQMGAALGAIARRPIAAAMAAASVEDEAQPVDITVAECNSQPHLAL